MHKQTKVQSLKELFIEIGNKFVESGEINSIEDIFEAIPEYDDDIFEYDEYEVN